MALFSHFYTAGPNGLWIFLLVSVLMGGATAYVAGRAVAETWRPFWHAIAYALIIGLAARFIHFALFDEVLLSARNYGVDCIVLLAAATVGFNITRRRQMQQQYGLLQGGVPDGAGQAAE